MNRRVYLAVDLGASSGRVLAGLFDGERLELGEVHRFANAPVNVNGRLYWQVFHLWSEVLAGLRLAARQFGEEIASVGVDAWGVDFGLVDRHGELLAPPVAYRDDRTRGVFERAFADVPRGEIFAETGVQFLELNTLFQLLAVQHIGSPPLDRAARLLLMPDLFHWMLSGVAANERTIASTTQLLNPHTGGWSRPLIERFGLPQEIFGDIVAPGTKLGPVQARVADDTGLKNVQVVLPGSHDTASAVLAVPACYTPPSKGVAGGAMEQASPDSSQETSAGSSLGRPRPWGVSGGAPDWCYISSGTWSLMGVEAPRPVINDDVFRGNFTNEAGVAGTTRLLKNISGLWLMQECQRAWRHEGYDYDWHKLMLLAEEVEPLVSVIDPDHPRLMAPRNMPAEIVALCRESGQPAPASHGAVIRCALESLALKYCEVLGLLERLGGQRIERIHLVGGGTQNTLLCQMAANACGRMVIAGPVEATAIGNCLMQAIAAGDVADVAEARELVRRSFKLHDYQPQADERWAAARERLTDARGGAA
ncbi:MAG: rhamnulokinase [Planctomycetota bacterium]|nr:MAG: rhamnulokinase [Planctomycetota bacterium]